MIHLSNIRIHCFRGLKHLTLSDLSHFNLLVGPNNCGKSSILEAVACHLNPLNIEEWLSIARLREIKSSRVSPDYSLANVFPQSSDAIDDHALGSGWVAMDSQRPSGQFASLALYREQVSVRSEPSDLSTDDERELRIRQFSMGQRSDSLLPDSGGILTENDLATLNDVIGGVKLAGFRWIDQTFAGRQGLMDRVEKTNADLNYDYVGVATHRSAKETLDGVSRALRDGYRDGILHILRLVDPSLTGVEILEFADQPSDIYLRREKIISPISMFGDGIRRLVHIVGAAARAKNGFLLIDELEIGLHAKVMAQVLPRLIDLCEVFNVQIIATTHSIEVVDSFIETLVDTDPGPIVYRLPGRGKAAQVQRLAWPDVRRVRSEYGWEIR